MSGQPFGVEGGVLGSLFQESDVDQDTGEDEQHRHCVGSPTERPTD